MSRFGYSGSTPRAPVNLDLEAEGSETWEGMTPQQVVLRYAPLVKYVAGRISLRLPQSIEMDDLFQAGILGLIDAVAKFEPDRGFKFRTYAEFRIRGAILDELRAMDWVPRTIRQAASSLEAAYRALESKHGRPAEDTEVAEYLGISLEEYYVQLDTARSISVISFEDLLPNDGNDDSRDIADIIADPNVPDPVEAIGLQELRSALSAAIDELPERERLLVSLYYFEELTMQEIGVVMGLTESRISQLHTKAALRMRAKIRRVLTTKKR